MELIIIIVAAIVIVPPVIAGLISTDKDSLLGEALSSSNNSKSADNTDFLSGNSFFSNPSTDKIYQNAFSDTPFTDYRTATSDHNWEADGDVRWDDIGPFDPEYNKRQS